MSKNDDSVQDSSKWLHPNQLLKLQKLKFKKKQLQARISNSELNFSQASFNEDSAENKRPNPFTNSLQSNKRSRLNESETSCDQTLFNFLHINQNVDINKSLTNNTLPHNNSCLNDNLTTEKTEKLWIPIDWTLNSKLRILSSQPFSWSHKLKISEEASGITAFVRCLNHKSDTTLDTSSNAKFHQCCLFWQQPYFPWLNLFPRSQEQCSTGTSIATTALIRENLHMAWSDGLRSLFQLLRTRQCPFFYVCTNTFTVLFRAAGICGYAEMIALVSPTTYGFRQLLKQEEIEFTMPLKPKCEVEETECKSKDDDTSDDQWLQSMGINEEERKQINYTQKRLLHKAECDVDNSEQSLIMIQGMEVHGLYNFLINCTSATSITGPLAGIPPTLLSPIAFQGATLCNLKVKEAKILVDNLSYYSLELTGPILPHIIHNLAELNSQDRSFTAIFKHLSSSIPFSKLQEPDKPEKDDTSGFSVFSKENLRDCGLNASILKHFCSSQQGLVQTVDSIKYNPEKKSYSWL